MGRPIVVSKCRFAAMTERVRNKTMPDIASAKDILFELQVEQHHHDEAYHREIARLSLHHRLNHMALHFAKYAGKVAAKSSVRECVPVFVDTLIIALSTANILNVELWGLLETEGREYPGLLAFGRSLAAKAGIGVSDYSRLVANTAIASGRMAAACEKIDHLEEILFRAEVRTSIASLATTSLAVISAQGIDPAQAVHERLDSVKKRSILHGRI